MLLIFAAIDSLLCARLYSLSDTVDARLFWLGLGLALASVVVLEVRALVLDILQ